MIAEPSKTISGNYFATATYLSQDLGTGTIRNRAGGRIAALSDDGVISLMNVLEKELGDRAPVVLKRLGQDWGRRAAEQFMAELSEYRNQPFADQALASFAADLTSAFAHHGWGSFSFDFSRYAAGIIVVEVATPFLGCAVVPTGKPIEHLLAGFLAGMFGRFADVEIDGLQTECVANGSDQSRFVLSLAERLEKVASGVGQRSHLEIVNELEVSG